MKGSETVPEWVAGTEDVSARRIDFEVGRAFFRECKNGVMVSEHPESTFQSVEEVTPPPQTPWQIATRRRRRTTRHR